MFNGIRGLLSGEDSVNTSGAIRRGLELLPVNSGKSVRTSSSLSFIFSSFIPSRPGSLFDLIRDLNPSLRIDLIQISTNLSTDQIPEDFINQLHATRGMFAVIEMTGSDGSSTGSDHMRIKQSSDLTLIETEIETVKTQAVALEEIKSKYEKSREPEVKPEVAIVVKPEKYPERDIWIPSRETLLSISRRNEIRPSTTPTGERSKTIWYPPSSLAKPPTVNNIYPQPPKTAVKLLTRPKIPKKSDFYLHDTGKEKGQTVYLTSSCRPPPIIPSALKITPNESN